MMPSVTRAALAVLQAVRLVATGAVLESEQSDSAQRHRDDYHIQTTGAAGHRR